MTRQQNWAIGARECVMRFTTSGDKGKLKTYCMKAPSLLQHSGTVQALAFLASRRGPATAFLDGLASVYFTGGQQTVPATPGRNLLELATKHELSEYLSLSRDLIEVSAWFRRFAQIEMEGIDEQENN